MNTKKYCSLLGHREDYGDIYEELIEHIVFAIEEKNIIDFLIGSQGAFDDFCKVVLNDVRKFFFPDIKIHLVLAYPKTKNTYIDPFFYDVIYYQKLKDYLKKFAIIKRNKMMVDNSSYIIFNVNRETGGAYKMLEYAKKKNKDFINFKNDEEFFYE